MANIQGNIDYFGGKQQYANAIMGKRAQGMQLTDPTGAKEFELANPELFKTPQQKAQESAGLIQSAAPAPSFTPRAIRPEETVSHQLSQLTKSGSPYIESARNRGLELANRRGLINTSIAAGASERAAIEAALPVASADAGTYAQSGLSAQQAGQQGALNQQQGLLSATLQQLKTDDDIRLAQMGDEAAMKRLETSNQFTATQNERNIAANKELQAQKEASTMAVTKYLNETIPAEKQATMTATERNTMAQTIAPIFQQLTKGINDIQITSDTVMDAASKENAIKNLTDDAYAAAGAIASLYGFKLVY